MFERFTDQSRRAIVLAQEEARQLNHDHIGTEPRLAGRPRGQPSPRGNRGASRARVIGESESRREGLAPSPPPRLRVRAQRTVMSDPVQALLDTIDDRLSAIERHLGMDSGGPENVIPPS